MCYFWTCVRAKKECIALEKCDGDSLTERERLRLILMPIAVMFGVTETSKSESPSR
jgi:hypothetical protein